MRLAIEGCSHGELDIIYKTLERLEQIHKMKIDLLLCCGDFQSVRNEQDLRCMAVPLKYMQMQDFHQYYSGEKTAPILTIFIGGNHEASNYLQELPYGGWVAPNIYYLGYAGVISVGGLRIGGLSGIYKGSDYSKGHYEKPVYTASSIRSVYHVRNLEVFRLKQLSKHMDIFLSHDWPRGIYNHGNKQNLIKIKPHFKDEVASNTLGSRAAEELIGKLQPDYWFSGHLHVKFAAVLKHENELKNKSKITKFLALDKCLPRREFLQILTLPSDDKIKHPLEINHDPEWLTVLRLTNHLLSTSSRTVYMPGPGSNERYIFTPSQLDIDETLMKLGGSWAIPQSNFVQTAKTFDVSKRQLDMCFVEFPKPHLNSQTINLCSKLELDDPVQLLLDATNSSQANMSSSLCDSSITSSCNETYASNFSSNPDEINTSDMYNDEDDSGMSKLSRDEASGDFILEMNTESPVGKVKENTALAGISPIRGIGHSTPKRHAIFGPVASSPRFSAPTSGLTQHKRLSLSKPSKTNESLSPLSLSPKHNSLSEPTSENADLISNCISTDKNPSSGQTYKDSMPVPILKNELNTVHKVNDDFISFNINSGTATDLTRNHSLNKGDNSNINSRVENSKEVEGDSSLSPNVSPPSKRECAFSETILIDCKGDFKNTSTKKFKRRNASIYCSNDC